MTYPTYAVVARCDDSATSTAGDPDTEGREVSTRETIGYAKGRWHLYHDLADAPGRAKTVRLRLEIHGMPFEASNDRNGSVVTVALPPDLAAALLRGLGKAGAALDKAKDGP